MAAEDSTRSVLKQAEYLDLPISPDNVTILRPTAADFSLNKILVDAAAVPAGKRMATRKLNTLGEQVGACCIATSDERLSQLQQTLNLAVAIETRKQDGNRKRAAATAGLTGKHATKRARTKAISVARSNAK